jgi:hypothetical protein
MTKTDNALPRAILAAFEIMIEITLEGLRDVEEEDGGRAGEYGRASHKVFAEVRPEPWNIETLHLERDRPPRWVRGFPELVELWRRGHLAYYDEEIADSPRGN